MFNRLAARVRDHLTWRESDSLQRVAIDSLIFLAVIIAIGYSDHLSPSACPRCNGDTTIHQTHHQTLNRD